MATRPLAFGVKLRDKKSGRTVRVLQDRRDPHPATGNPFPQSHGEGGDAFGFVEGQFVDVLSKYDCGWPQREHRADRCDFPTPGPG